MRVSLEAGRLLCPTNALPRRGAGLSILSRTEQVVPRPLLSARRVGGNFPQRMRLTGVHTALGADGVGPGLAGPLLQGECPRCWGLSHQRGREAGRKGAQACAVGTGDPGQRARLDASM